MTSAGCLFASKLPVTIRKARARALEHPSLFSKGRVIALVQTLITYTNLDSIESPVLFNRKKPAQILDVSTRTIDRLLNSLEALGWLQRLKQPRLKCGGWGVTTILWAPWVLKDIFALSSTEDKWGRKVRPNNKNQSKPQKPSVPSSTQPLKQAQKPSKEASILPKHRETKMAHLSSSPKGEVLHNKLSTKDQINNTFDPFNEKKKRGRRIPEDLVDPMHELELTPSNICWLMAKCKQQGIQLQHVLSVALTGIRKRALKSSQAIAYLVHMIKVKKDYAYLAKEQSEAQALIKRSQRRTKWLEKMAKHAFKSGIKLPDGQIVLNVMDELVMLGDSNESPLGAAPKVKLVERLIRKYPHWARRLGKKCTTRPLSTGETVLKNEIKPDSSVTYDYLNTLRNLTRGHRWV